MPRKKDENETAFSALQQLIRRDLERDGIDPGPEPTEEKDPKKVAAGKKGGVKGGKARAASLTPQKRRAIAKKAAQSRWGKHALEQQK
jgi:hypothetical protein